jgi:hypothetical protein
VRRTGHQKFGHFDQRISFLVVLIDVFGAFEGVRRGPADDEDLALLSSDGAVERRDLEGDVQRNYLPFHLLAVLYPLNANQVKSRVANFEEVQERATLKEVFRIDTE